MFKPGVHFLHLFTGLGVPRIWGQVFDQIFGQGFDQGFGEGKDIN